jgi:hypothetical protein
METDRSINLRGEKSRGGVTSANVTQDNILNLCNILPGNESKPGRQKTGKFIKTLFCPL